MGRTQIARRFLLASLFTILGPALNAGFASALQSESFCGTNQSAMEGVAGMNPAIGQKKLLTILVNFAENPTDRVAGNLAGQNYTTIENAADGQQLLFNDPSHLTVKDWFTEASYGQMQLTGDVAGYFTLNIPISSISNSSFRFTVSTQALAAAANAGFNPANYDFTLFSLAIPNAISGSAGVASGNQMWASNLSFNIVVHELGHCLGIKHANVWNCANTTWISESQCTLQEYGDPYDCMGNSGSGHYNSHFKYSLGWLTEAQIPTVTQNGTFTLSPLETIGGLKALRIPGSDGRDLYIEFRQLIGFDQIAAAKYGINFPSNGFDGVFAYRSPVPVTSDAQYGETGLLDMTPNSNTDPERPDLDIIDCTLRPGLSFLDTMAGVRVRALSMFGSGTNAQLTVEVQFSNLQVELGSDRVVPYGGQTVLTPTITGGIPPYTCNWSPNFGLSGCTPTFIASGFSTQSISYLLSVTDSSLDPVPAGDQITILISLTDCNHNNIQDSTDILFGISQDINHNGIPDECESNVDCNHNGLSDIYDIQNGLSADCNGNSIPDSCENLPDCNANNILDVCDIQSGVSVDCDLNGIPDNCPGTHDCNHNGILDSCEIQNASAEDCNGNLIPDDCDIQAGVLHLDWARSFGTSYIYGSLSQGRNIAADIQGNIYLTGSFVYSADFDPSGEGVDIHTADDSDGEGLRDIYVTKIGPAGNYLWTQSFGGAFFDSSSSLTIDNAGNVYVVGGFSGSCDFDPNPTSTDIRTSNGNSDVFLIKLDSNGNKLWAITFGGNGADYGKAVASDNQGGVFIAGDFYSSADFDPSSLTDIHGSNGISDVFISKFDLNGNWLWTETLGGVSLDTSQSLIVSGGDIVIGGAFSAAVDFNPSPLESDPHIATGTDIFISKFGLDGSYRWSQTFRGSLNSLAADESGNIFATGTFLGSIDFDPDPLRTELHHSFGFRDVFISKFQADKTYLWTRTFGGISSDYGNSLDIDADGEILLTGSFNGTVDLDPSPTGVNTLTSNGLNDMFISKFGEDGSYRWTQRVGGTNQDIGLNLVTNENGHAFLLGSAFGNINLDPSGGEPLESYGLFIAQFRSSPADANLNYALDVCEAPVMGSVGNKSILEGQLLSFQVSASDVLNRPITITATQANGQPVTNLGAFFTHHGQGTETFVWRPTHAQVGNHQIVFTASNGVAAASQIVTITVNPLTPTGGKIRRVSVDPLLRQRSRD